MTSLSVVIMAHTSRQGAAERLAAELDCPMSLDDGSAGENANGDRAWAMTDPDADWAIVIQDDALLIPDFLTHAAAALEVAPRTCVSFYTGTVRPRAQRVLTAIEAADAHGHAWLQANTLLWGVAVAIPREHVLPMLEHTSRLRLPYDERIGKYFLHHSLPVRYTWPSLVDHDDTPSLVGHLTPGRHAHRVGATVTWATEATTI